MRKHQVHMVEGGQYVNMVAPEGTSFPANPDNGEIFFRSDLKQLFVCKDSTGPEWRLVGESYRTFELSSDVTAGEVVKMRTDGRFGQIDEVILGPRLSEEEQIYDGTSASADNPGQSFIDPATDKIHTFFSADGDHWHSVGTISGDDITWTSPMNIGTWSAGPEIKGVISDDGTKVLILTEHSSGIRVTPATVSGDVLTLYPGGDEIVGLYMNANTDFHWHENTEQFFIVGFHATGGRLTGICVQIDANQVYVGNRTYISTLVAGYGPRAIYIPPINRYVVVDDQAAQYDGYIINIPTPGSSTTPSDPVSSASSPFSLFADSSPDSSQHQFDTTNGLLLSAFDTNSNDYWTAHAYTIGLDSIVQASTVGLISSTSRNIKSDSSCFITSQGLLAVANEDVTIDVVSDFYLKWDVATSEMIAIAEDFDSTPSQPYNPRYAHTIYHPTEDAQIVIRSIGPSNQNIESSLIRFDFGGLEVAKAKGVAQEDGLVGETKQIALHGDVSAVHSGLSPSVDYFVSDIGLISTTRTRMVLGYAISDTELLLTIDDRTIYNDQVDFPRIPQSFQVADITARDLIVAVESDMALVDDADGLGNPATYHYNNSAWLEIQTTHDGGTYGP